MKIVIILDGPKEHALVLTGVVRALQKQYAGADILVCTNEENFVFFLFMGIGVANLGPSKDQLDCDLLIDYGGSDKAVALSLLFQPQKYMGLIDREGSVVDQHAFRGLYLKQEVNRNLFQLMFGVAGLKWAGEGYGFPYFPKARQRKGRVGVAVRDRAVRRFLISHLQLDESRVWNVPFRQNVFKQFDEVNRVPSIVTDDEFIMHVGLAMRKRVELLIYEPPTVKPEFFGDGCLHLVPASLKLYKGSVTPLGK